MLRETLLWASRNAWLRDQLPRQGFVRRAVRRFMPGEEVAEALDACEPFRRHGIGVVLTELGENVADADAARAVVADYADLLGEIRRRGLDAEISVKPTHLGFDVGAAIATSGVERLAALSAADGRVLWVDMEGSAYTEPTLALYHRVRAAQPATGLCVQAYLYRTREDLETLCRETPRVRLVKGAYAEPAAIAWPRKEDVDTSFFRLAARLLEAAAAAPGARAAIATHDRAMIARVIAHAGAKDIPRDRFEFQMLYGIARDEQYRLAAAGYRVRVLISYGSAWYPWYMRRLAERPANLWFVARSLVSR